MNAEVREAEKAITEAGGLQWSRVHVNAEVCWCRAYRAERRSRLQWSRVHVNAEVVVPTPVMRPVYKLQWSRVHVNAEVMLFPRFLYRRWWLQWSRVHVNAEVS